MHQRKNIVEKIVKKYLLEINKLYPIDIAILYGSYASGRLRKGSDIDLAIFSKKITDYNRLKIMKQYLTRIYKYKMDFQPIAFNIKDYTNDENDFIRDEIKKRGKVVFGTIPGKNKPDNV